MSELYKLSGEHYPPDCSEVELALAGPKLHGIAVTECMLNYHGSITLDTEFLEIAGLYPLEFVHIWNKQSGARISTYILPGERGSKICCLNGAAARTCQIGDNLIITCERRVRRKDVHSYRVNVLLFADNNIIEEVLEYRLELDDSHCSFTVFHRPSLS